MIHEPTAVISSQIVPNNERALFLCRLFGSLTPYGENNIFNQARRLCKEYDGGSWKYIKLSIGGGYLVPECAEYFNVSVPGNYFEGELSADATGIVLTLFTLNALIFLAWDKKWHNAQEELFKQSERLKGYASQHKEKVKIFAAID